MGLLDAISPTPRNRIIGLLADATQGVNDFASKPFGYDNPPARMLMGLLGVPSIATTLDRLSYGEPLTNAGKANVPLLKPETADAAMAALPGIVGAISGVRRTLNAVDPVTNASKSVKIYAPKPVEQRPFNADYPTSVDGSMGSQLTVDIEGRPLVARHVVGRQTVGGLDQGLANGDAGGVAEALGTVSRRVAAGEIGGDAGRYSSGGGRREILISNSTPDEKLPLVFNHELGHNIDDLTFGLLNAGGSRIPTKGIEKELKAVYEDLNTGTYFKRGRGATPKGQGYSDSKAGAEMIAEAIRAYLADPNYLKTIAPKTAARIREAVNSNQNLKNVIQFNSLAGGVVGAGLLQDQQD